MKNFTLLTAIMAVVCQFTLAQAPAITSFTPASGPIGAQVIISGANFSPTATDNHVYFGAVKAVVQTASTTSLTVTVPVGATFQPLSVTVNNLIAYAARPFMVTYTGGGMDFTPTSFAAPTTLAGDINVTAADLDGDNRIDLIYGYSGNKITVYRNTTAGGPLSFTPIDIGTFSLPINIKAGDVNGDGLLDLVAASPSQNLLYVLKNTSTPGNISFSSPITLNTGVEPRKVVIGDLDNDGKADIACSRISSDGVSVFRNTSSGSNITFDTKVDFVVAGLSEGIAIGDLNEDGKPEIVAANSSNITMSVLVNTSTPGTISFSPKVDYFTGNSPQEVAIADIDGDGKADMISSNSTGNSITVFRTTATNPLTFDTRVDLPASTGPYGMALNDLNADGKPDIVTANNFSATSDISILKNTSTPGNITFAPFVTYGSNTGTTSVALADLDNDGLTDIAAGSFQRTTLSIFKNQLNISICIPAANPYNITETAGTTICATNSVRIITNATSNIQWFFNNEPIAGATSNFIQANKDGAYTMRILNGSCYSAPTNAVQVTILPTPAKPVLSQISDTTFCEGGSVNLVSSLDINNEWFKDNMKINDAAGISYTATTTGDYFVRVKNESSGCYNFSDTVAITVRPAPLTPTITINGNPTFCTGNSVSLSSSDAIVSYQWFVDGTPINGANDKYYTATTAGTYTVKTIGYFSCTSATSAGAVLTTTPLVAGPTISFAGGNSFCAGDSLLMHSSIASPVQWYKDHSVIPGATNQDYRAKVAGLYTATTTGNGCPSSESNSLSPTVWPLPLKPMIASNGTSLSTASGFTSYVWYRDNVLIPGATANQYNTTQNGLYKVTVGDANGCKSTSDNFNYVTTGLDDIYVQGYTIQLYPNPVINTLNIQVKQTLTSNGNLSVQVKDVTGRHIQSQTLKQGNNTVYFKNLTPGVYWILLKNGRSEKTIKLLKAQ